MNREEISNKVQNIFRDIFDDPALVINDSTSSNDIDEWDSLNHIQLVVAIEKHYKIRFTSHEIQSWKNIEEMLDCIASKTGLHNR